MNTRDLESKELVGESLDACGRDAGSERSSVGFGVLDRYESLLTKFEDRAFTLMDLTADVFKAQRLWNERYPDVRLRVVYSRTDDAVQQDVSKSIYVSKTFGLDYWLDVVSSCDLDVILSDGRVSVYHQMQMFRILFPGLRSGGIFILENCVESPDSKRLKSGKRNALMYDFFLTLTNTMAGKDDSKKFTDDFWNYCFRNIESIEYFGDNIIIRKRENGQSKLTAVEFQSLARDHESLDTPSAYSRIPAQVYGSTYIASRVEKLIETAGKTIPPRAEIGILENAKVIGQGIVVVNDKFVVRESFINLNHTSRRGPLYRIESSDLYVSESSLDSYRSMPAGETYVSVKQTWDANYGHWLVDTLPRVIGLGRRMDLSSARMVMNGNRSAAMKTVFADSLSLLNIRGDQLEWTDHRPVHFDQLVYATPTSIPPFVKSEFSIRQLESLVELLPNNEASERRGSKKIYLSRNRYPRRRLLNEDDILPVLAARGYEIVYPEELSLFEQIALFSSADYVIGNMGAAFSNLAFSPAGVNVFMLATGSMMHDYFYDLVCHKNGSYVALQGRSVPPSKDIGADFLIDIVEFERLLDEFDPIEL